MEEDKSVITTDTTSDTTTDTTVTVKPTILVHIKDKMNDQDFNQKVTVCITVILELYRVLVSSFLVLFVPQKCGEHVCSLSENMVFENHLYNAGLVFNFITMAAFLAMYTFELKRENRLITYLDVNKSVASDNNSVGVALEKLPVDKRNSIWQLDKYYMYSGWSSIIMFIINTILSGFVVYEYYLDSQTTSTYITNILFMVTKLVDVHSNVNTEKNVFYSAYMKGKIQYNDVDPNKIVIPYFDETVTNANTSSDVESGKQDISVPGVNPPVPNNSEERESDSEDEKIIVTVHDINSPKTSTNDLQQLDN